MRFNQGSIYPISWTKYLRSTNIGPRHIWKKEKNNKNDRSKPNIDNKDSLNVAE